ncbi:MAG: hypothetical protein HQL93_09870 [Magnetococcales bacterium]|nr:hypothetical protein [Magnetococcales bacterium]
MARIDAHVITPEEYEEIPELTDAFFAEADEYFAGKLIRRGRPFIHFRHTTTESIKKTVPKPVSTLGNTPSSDLS